ncbi:MAG: ABC transporter permease [Anaerolineae bacterium]|uniref:ABC transporter permease n=1 Tax=Thermoflexus sp. TaxID=1969742 RepID=UPI0025EC4BE3|nr:ABC transporter permease [Thermoflexus sp.]MCS7351758.1 ABC transporter permease [Thermoflexus sp.]MDW8181217.1 ABC transporter permease [Anaerolineae bacterium]
MLRPALGTALMMGLWWGGTHPSWLGSHAFLASFSPAETLPALWHLVSSGTLTAHALLSLKRVLIGLALAIGLSVPIGLILGLRPLAEQTMLVPLHVLRTVSPLSWTPLAIILLGVGDLAVIALIVVATIWPILFSTAAGIRQLEPGWLLMARSVGARGVHLVAHVILPAILPQIIGGVRLAVGLAWVVLVPAEMLGVSSGLGYFLLNTRDRLAYAELMATILAIGVIGLGLDVGVRQLAKALPGARR